MSDLSSVRAKISVESSRFRSAVSEFLVQRMGSSINALLDDSTGALTGATTIASSGSLHATTANNSLTRTIYTCPTGKKAFVNLGVKHTGFWAPGGSAGLRLRYFLNGVGPNNGVIWDASLEFAPAGGGVSDGYILIVGTGAILNWTTPITGFGGGPIQTTGSFPLTTQKFCFGDYPSAPSDFFGSFHACHYWDSYSQCFVLEEGQSITMELMSGIGEALDLTAAWTLSGLEVDLAG